MKRFVVLEGMDGAGTTTQCAKLGVREGFELLKTREPTDDPIGAFIRESITRETLPYAGSALPYLFAADRAAHIDDVVKPALRRGGVLCDRYVLSSLAYQSLEISMERVWELNRNFLAPDLTVFLDIEVDESLRRLGVRGEQAQIFETKENLTKIHAAYKEAIKWVEAHGQRVLVLDGSQSIESISNTILEELGDPWCVTLF